MDFGRTMILTTVLWVHFRTSAVRYLHDRTLRLNRVVLNMQAIRGLTQRRHQIGGTDTKMAARSIGATLCIPDGVCKGIMRLVAKSVLLSSGSRWMLSLVVFLAILSLGTCFSVSSPSGSPMLQRQMLPKRLSCQLNMASNALSTDSPRQLVQRGMQRFRQADIDGSIELFDQAERLDPSLRPFLWQRGISYYYANRFQEGSDQVMII